MSTVTRVYSRVRGISTAIKDGGRAKDIVAILVRHGFGALVTRLKITDAIGIKSVMEYRDENDELYSTPQRLRMAIEELGPTFVKLGQILSTRGDLVPPEFIEELQTLQDDVPVVPWEDVERQVLAYLGGSSLDEHFASFEKEPLASASIAQVHRATLHEGGEVVVKVQRPHIADSIDSDLSILHFLARQAEALIPELSLMDPVGIVGEFDKAIRKELDFHNELYNIQRFQQNFKNFEGVRIPKAFPQVSARGVLTMEFMEGVKVTLAPEKLNVDPYVLAPRMLRALFKMIFQDGFFHGDLHPGNILISADGTIGLIDFGLVGRLNESQRNEIMDVIIAMIREDYQGLARAFFDIGIKVPGVRYDYARFEQDVVEIMEKHLEGRTLNDIDVGAFFGDLVTGAIRHQIKMPPAFTMVFKAFVTIEGLGKTLAPELNFLEEAGPFAKELLADRYSPRKLVAQGVDTLGTFSRLFRQLPLTLSQVLYQTESGELRFKIQVDDLDKLADAERSSGLFQAHAMVAGACIVGGSIATTSGPGNILGLNPPAFILFLVGAVLGLPLFLRRLRQR